MSVKTIVMVPVGIEIEVCTTKFNPIARYHRLTPPSWSGVLSAISPLQRRPSREPVRCSERPVGFDPERWRFRDKSPLRHSVKRLRGAAFSFFGHERPDDGRYRPKKILSARRRG